MNIAKILSLVLVSALLLCGCGSTKDPAENDALSPTTEPKAYTLEGAGFDSPDDAVLAYLDAMRHGDVNKMISTFAIESLVDNYNIVADFERTNTYTTNNTYPFQGDDAYTRSILLFKRQAQLNHTLMCQYFNLNIKDPSIIGYQMNSSAFDEFGYDTPEEFFDDLTNPDWMDILADMTYGAPLTQEQLHDILPDRYWEDMDRIEQNIEQKKAIFGYDDYASVAVKVHFNENDYYFFMDVACYNGKWYNFEHGGIMALMLGVSIYDAGFALIED